MLFHLFWHRHARKYHLPHGYHLWRSVPSSRPKSCTSTLSRVSAVLPWWLLKDGLSGDVRDLITHLKSGNSNVHLIFCFWSIGSYLVPTALTILLTWTPGFVIAAAIPQIQTISGLVAAIAVVQFSYTFPPLFMLGYNVMVDGASKDRPYIPESGTKGRIDTWRGWSRWKRVSVDISTFAWRRLFYHNRDSSVDCGIASCLNSSILWWCWGVRLWRALGCGQLLKPSRRRLRSRERRLRLGVQGLCGDEVQRTKNRIPWDYFKHIMMEEVQKWTSGPSIRWYFF